MVRESLLVLLVLCGAVRAKNLWRHAGELVGDVGETNSTTHFFSGARLDHFGARLGETWKQRFYIDDTFWDGQGPVLMLIGGEGPRAPPRDSYLAYQMAKEHNGLLLALEHRFYGESYPTKDMASENLVYLTSQQALADMSVFIQWLKTTDTSGGGLSEPSLSLKHTLGLDSKWVLFGGSYPGNLAAWFCVKYAHQVSGCVSSSAPVRAEVNFEAYAAVVGSALSYELIGGSDNCYSTLTAAIDEVQRAVEKLMAGETSTTTLPPALEACSPFVNMSSMDLTAYQSDLFGHLQGMVQYNEQRVNATRVRDVCSLLVVNGEGATGQDAVNRFANVTALFSDASKPWSERCVSSSYDEDMVEPLTNVTFSGLGCDLKCSSYRQWFWQTCNEFGYFQTTTENKLLNVHPFAAFSLTVESVGSELCERAFGKTSLPPTNLTNGLYGERRVIGSNITMVNGNMDPWHALSVSDSGDRFFQSCQTSPCATQFLSDSVVQVTIDGTSHCRDMKASKESDSDSLKNAQALVNHTVALWIGAIHEPSPSPSALPSLSASPSPTPADDAKLSPKLTIVVSIIGGSLCGFIVIVACCSIRSMKRSRSRFGPIRTTLMTTEE